MNYNYPKLLVSIYVILTDIDPARMFEFNEDFNYFIEAVCIANSIQENNITYDDIDLAYLIRGILEDLLEFDVDLSLCLDCSEAIKEDLKWGWGLII